jgi:hypothetical protein
VSFPDGQVLLSVYDAVTDTVLPSLVKPAGDAVTGQPGSHDVFAALHHDQHGCDALDRMAQICLPTALPAASGSLLDVAERMMSSAEPVEITVPACGKRWRCMASRRLQVLVGALVPD